MLNFWMKGHKGFSGLNVVWATITGYSEKAILEGTPEGRGLGYDTVLNKTILPTTLPSLVNMDVALSAGRPVIAQVLNPDTGINHWVVVTGRISGGKYTILDPGGKLDRVILNDSYKVIYRYIPIRTK